MQHKFEKNAVSDVEVFLAEPNDYVREGMRSVLRNEGFRRTRSFSRTKDLLEAIEHTSPDFLIAADDLEPNIFDVVRDIRHFKVGRNPFLMITLMVQPKSEDSVRRAILAGADDIIIKPVVPGKILERGAYLTKNRLPFIVTTDYVGPERRRQTERESKIPHLQVLNTLRDKVEGRRMSQAELNKAVEGCMAEVMAARLESQGLKLGWVCTFILTAYEEKRIDKELQDRLLILVSVLEEASGTARLIGEPELSGLCAKLARQIEEMAEDYENPSSAQLDTVRKLTKAFELARSAKSAGAKAAPPAG